jgi:hypothetical protein
VTTAELSWKLRAQKAEAKVRELTAQLEQTLVIARQALVYFNTESGRAAMEELEKIEGTDG